MTELSEEFDMPIVSCKETDCQRKVQARGMCSTHYSYWHRAKNGRTDKVHSKTCAHCSQAFTTITARVVFCSLTCAARAKVAKSTDVVRYPRAKTWIGHVLPSRNGRPLVAGACRYCGTYYTGWPGSTYCSTKCRMNAKLKRKYDIRGEFKVTDIVRHSIYARDNYTCQLCREPVDKTLHYAHPMAATLDHIIPQSWMLIPDHSETNLRLAHRRCNAARGARSDAA